MFCDFAPSPLLHEIRVAALGQTELFAGSAPAHLPRGMKSLKRFEVTNLLGFSFRIRLLSPKRKIVMPTQSRIWLKLLFHAILLEPGRNRTTDARDLNQSRFPHIPPHAPSPSHINLLSGLGFRRAYRHIRPHAATLNHTGVYHSCATQTHKPTFMQTAADDCNEPKIANKLSLTNGSLLRQYNFPTTKRKEYGRLLT